MDPVWQWPALLGTGLTAGFVDTIAGGGGLIALPVLLSLGLPPQDALGTNKFQASFGSGSATIHYARAGVVNLKECTTGILFTFIGAMLGTLAVLEVDAGLLRRIIPVLLIAIAIYLTLKPSVGFEDTRPRMRRTAFYTLFGLGLGFYDGFFGPGTGTFWAMALIFFLGFNLTKATGHTKAMNFASNLVSLIVFVGGGHVLYGYGLVMAVGQLVGAKLGAHLVVNKGARFIRPVFLTVVLAITAKLLYEGFVTAR